NREMTNITESTQTQRTRWTVTSISTRVTSQTATRRKMLLGGRVGSSQKLIRLDQDISQTAPQNPATPSQQPTGGLCSRTYITFSDDEAFEAAFPPSARSGPQFPVQEICPVTHKTALYRDPVTDIPYANARAFRIIREAYRKYVAAHGFPSSLGGGAGGDCSVMKGVRQKMVVKQSGVTT
ncbi:hypothetical protein GOODEAATRI_007049, partial [Goodea atripinnis]